MRHEDSIRWQHMVEAAEDALRFITGRGRADLDHDRMLLYAVVRAIEIVGEAASKVSPEARAAHGEIPWPAIIGMRNRLAHAYFEIDTDIVWVAVTDELPVLLAQLQAVKE